MGKIIFFLGCLLLLGNIAFAGTCLEGNCQDGSGTYQWDDGSKFTGNFVNGLPDGQGIYTAPNGTYKVVLYKDGKLLTRPNPAHHPRRKQ
jgi:hypothetical protein